MRLATGIVVSKQLLLLHQPSDKDKKNVLMPQLLALISITQVKSQEYEGIVSRWVSSEIVIAFTAAL